jgi:hypothetical protein
MNVYRDAITPAPRTGVRVEVWVQPEQAAEFISKVAKG